ncbi:unnamed protein product, partial [Mesorhabditis belari]|uniref:Uncharacterized protein n=1 Tax=Mesorhabditis belari TaxID=2138241 RepID=A0AAF3EI81_9BILA
MKTAIFFLELTVLCLSTTFAANESDSREIQVIPGHTLEGKHSTANCRHDLQISQIWNWILGSAAGLFLLTNVVTLTVFNRVALGGCWHRLVDRIRHRNDDPERENMMD